MTYRFHDFSKIPGRVFVVGDIHGCFGLLEKELSLAGYNADRDKLVSVGDLVDRGPDSMQAMEWISRPDFYYVRGNHEKMLLDPDMECHLKNGGHWFRIRKDQDDIAKMLNDAPLGLEILTPQGHRVGVVHAAVPGDDWENVKEPGHELTMLWSRDPITWLEKTGHVPSVKGIDHVFFGHTPVRNVITGGNSTWIDTCAFKTGKLTVLDVDRFMAGFFSSAA